MQREHWASSNLTGPDAGSELTDHLMTVQCKMQLSVQDVGIPGVVRDKISVLVQAREAVDRGEKCTYTVTEQLISDALGDLLKKKDLSKYIL